MLIKRVPEWAIAENKATSEAAYFNRRQLLAAGGLAAGALLAPGLVKASESDPTADLYPAMQNPNFTDAGRGVTPEAINTTYNNFYEFGSHKTISDAAQALQTRPWTVTFDGMVEEQKTVDIDTLIRAMPLEERVYRHRCVEAWSMVVPWSGFPMAKLVEFAKPLSGAKYVRMETFEDSSVASGQRAFWYPWPYVEGLTMAEATHDLAFMVTGAYGKPMAKQFGAPLRLAVPWKYGFKHIKSIVKFTFTDEQPVSFWTQLIDNEYGFWANVNPEVPHPRWSQATERDLETGERIPTQIYNGYGPQVAGLYSDLQDENLFM